MTRIAFVTNQPLFASGRQVFSEIASIRRELLLPARVLRERGHDPHLVSLSAMAPMLIGEELDRAECIVFGKLFHNPQRDGAEAFSSDAAGYKRILAQRRDDQRLYFCLSDDGFDSPVFAEFYGSMATRAHSWLVSSPQLRERIEAFSRRSAVICPEPVEMQPREARVPRRGLRARLGTALARRARVGLEPWRVRLVWFGHPSNLPSLTAVLPELETLASDIPLHLECVSQPVPELTSRVTSGGAEFSVPLRVSFTPWSLDAMQRALERCDAALLPRPVDERAGRTKTGSRLIDSLQAGRFVIAHPLRAYEELREYAWVGDSMSDGIRWLLPHPDEALERVRRGQEYVVENHSLDAFGGFWQAALGLRTVK